MSRRSRLALLALVAMAGVASCSLWAFHDDGSAAGPATQPFVRRAPGIARDGLHGAPTPTRAPSSQLDVVVRVEMQVMELSVVTGGTTPITIKAEARTTLPGYFDNPVSTRAHVFADAHPSDALLRCDWKTVYANYTVKVTISDSGGIFTRGVLIIIDQPPADASAWHFDVTCYPEPPSPPQHFRLPAAGERSVGEWLSSMGLGSSGAVIDTPDYSDPGSCIKRQGNIQLTHRVFGTAKITVYAVTRGCNVPP